jgi:hypothetical protein
MAYPTLTRCLWSSTPVIAGIWTSAIKQAVSTSRGDARKSAADEKASTAKPKDLMSLRMDSRKNRSSSTIETKNVFGIRPLSSHEPAIRVLQQCRRACVESCAKELSQAMPGPRKPWLSLDADSVMWVPRCHRANVGARKLWCRPCMHCGGERGCSYPPAGLAMSRTVAQILRTETRAHFRDPKSGVQRCLKS